MQRTGRFPVQGTSKSERFLAFFLVQGFPVPEINNKRDEKKGATAFFDDFKYVALFFRPFYY